MLLTETSWLQIRKKKNLGNWTVWGIASGGGIQRPTGNTPQATD